MKHPSYKLGTPTGFALTLLFLLSFQALTAQQVLNSSQFRGANHAGIFDEKNLLKQWPAEGPALLWSFDSLGNGYGSPSVTEKQVFIQGEKDSVASLFSFDLNGNLLWKSAWGREMMSGRYPGSLSTPTVVDSLAYCLSGMGDIACFNVSTGKKIWGLNMVSDLDGVMIPYGFSQSLLVDSDLVYCAPSGKQNNFAALNRFTGKVVWTCAAIGEPARCSPMMVERGGRKLIVATSSTSVLGIDGRTGEFLWSHVIDTSKNSHYNCPLFDGEYIYCFAFYQSKGVVKLKLSADGRQVTGIWNTTNLLNSIGGAVKAGDYLVAAHKGRLVCLNAKTGEISDAIPSGSEWGGVTLFAGGMIYLYNGQVRLVSLEAGKLKEVSHFEVTKGSNFHFAHPAIKNGVLYVRRGNALMAYRISG